MSTLTPYNGLTVITPGGIGAGGSAINNNFKALATHIDTVDPAGANDATQGYSSGSRWYNSTTANEWICLSAAPAAASWTIITGVIGDYMPLSGGTMTGDLNLNGHYLNPDSSSYLQSDGSGNLSIAATSVNFLVFVTCQGGLSTYLTGSTVQIQSRGPVSSVTWDVLNDGMMLEVLMNASASTLQNPTNLSAGGFYWLYVKTVTSSAIALTFGSCYKFAGGTPPTLGGGGSGSIDVLRFSTFDGINMICESVSLNVH